MFALLVANWPFCINTFELILIWNKYTFFFLSIAHDCLTVGLYFAIVNTAFDCKDANYFCGNFSQANS